MSTALANGFTAMIPPALVKPAAMEGTGFLGQAAQDVYHLPADDLYLVGTAEVPLAAYHSDEILDPARLPLRYAGFSPSFRREAGSHGKDTRGIFRVHWFDKVEMFSFCAPEEADAEHQRLLGWEKEFIDVLEIPYQVLELAAGDLGLSAARKYDCYGWLPTQDRYREITSTSNCTDFQARRLNVRARFEGGIAPGGDAQRDAVRDDPDDHHDLGESSAGRRIGTDSVRSAALPRRPGGPDTGAGARLLSNPSAGWRPRVVALDIDGTVVDHEGLLPVRVRDAIASVVAAEVPVVLATGRSWHGVRPLVDELGLPPGWSVASNGAVVVSYPPERIVKAVTFDPREVIERVGVLAPEALIAVEEIGRGYRTTGEFPGGDLTGEMIIERRRAAEFTPGDPGDRARSAALRRRVHRAGRPAGPARRGVLRRLERLAGHRPGRGDQGSGLADVVAELGLEAADVLAIGDGRNDVEMLEWAGRGVAMGQAPAEVHAAADAVTGTFDEGGVVTELRRWF